MPEFIYWQARFEKTAKKPSSPLAPLYHRKGPEGALFAISRATKTN